MSRWRARIVLMWPKRTHSLVFLRPQDITAKPHVDVSIRGLEFRVHAVSLAPHLTLCL